MKKLSTLILILCCVFAKSNTVYIPDSLFRVYINSVAPGAITGDSMNTTNATVTSLTTVNIYGLGIGSIEGIEYFTSLQTLKAANNHIAILPALSSSVSYLNVDSNALTSLQNIPAAVITLLCSKNQLAQINNLPATLQTLNCGNNYLLCLPTLPDTLAQLNATGNFFTCIPNLPGNPSFTSDIGVTICGDTECNRYTSISGYAYLDLNNNGVRDAGEPFLSNRIITLQPLGQTAETDSAGNYTLSGNPGLVETVIPEAIAGATTNPASASVHLLSPSASISNINFGYYFSPADSFSDVRTWATEGIRAIPGRDTRYSVTVNNVGGRTEQGRTIFVINTSLFTYVSSSPAATISGDTLIWNFSNFYPATSLNYTIYLQVNSGDAPGTPFQLKAYASIIHHDSVPSNNLSIIYDTIVRNFLRDNKTVSPAHYTGADFDTGQYFNYNITFQNQNTDTVKHIWIIDTLNSYFDMSTLYVVAASATYQLTITGHVLRIDFAGINMPDSTDNEVASHGFFDFIIRPLGVNFIGSIHNTATIYFDSAAAPPVGTGTQVCFSDLTLGDYTNPETFDFCASNVFGSATVVASEGQPPYTYLWTSGSTNAVANNLTAGYYIATVTDQCYRTAVAIVYVDSVFSPTCNTWLGISTDFTNAGNWTSGTPPGGCGDDAYLPGGLTHYPVLSGNAAVGKLQMFGNANISLNGFNLSVCGNLTAPTRSISGQGQLILNGTAAQTLSATLNLYELNINNTGGGVTLNTGSTIQLSNALDLQAGNLEVSAGTLRFLSTSTSDIAIIDNFSPGFSGSLTGNISVQRYYDASETFDQHFIGSPVNSPSVSQVGASGTAGYVTDSTCSELNVSHNSPYGTLFGYDESNGTTCGMDEWYVITSGSLNNAQGYSWRVSGSGILTLTGDANLGSSYSLSGLGNSNWSNTTLQGHELISGWQLVSNPYQATVNLTSIGSGLDGEIEVWGANGSFAGSYQSAVVGGGASIAPFQAFLVHSNGSGTFTINASDRSRTPQQFYDGNTDELKILATNTNSNLQDQTTVAFNTNATNGFDSQFDAMKLSGSLNRHTMYTLNGEAWMSRNVLHSIADNTSGVLLGFEPGATSNYIFTFSGINTFDPTVYISLEDKQLSTTFNIRNGSYSFSADSADNWNRFVLHFTPPMVINTQDATCNVAGSINITQPGIANWNYILTDASGNSTATGILNQDNPITVSCPAGNYTLTLIDANNYTVIKTIQVNGTNSIIAAFSVPSGIEVNTAASFSSNVADASSYTWNFGDGSATSTAANPVHSYANPGTYTVTLTVANVTGCISSVTHVITVNSATGITNVAGEDMIKLWSNDNRVYIDFTSSKNEIAQVSICNLLGQELSNEKVNTGTLYSKELDNISAAYVIVRVKQDEIITTKKLFIISDK